MKNKKKNLFKTVLKGMMIIPLLSILLTGCEKYEFEEVVITPPTLWGEWELIETSHNILIFESLIISFSIINKL